jgi:hypothetical protein
MESLFIRSRCAAVAAAAALAGSASASIVHTFTWDEQATGSLANSFAQPPGLGVTFSFAALLPETDEFGDVIPGSERWRQDLTAPPVIVDNPQNFGRGNAPSPVNALEALFQPVLISFAAPFTLDPAGFSAVLDNDVFGANGFLPGNADIAVQFLDAGANPLLITPVDQTTPGYVVSGGGLTVSSILLPAGAFYDNVFISGIPEPTSVLLMLAGGLLVRRR